MSLFRVPSDRQGAARHARKLQRRLRRRCRRQRSGRASGVRPVRSRGRDTRRIMNSSSEGYRPTQSDHIRQSELCATCHTLLITNALGPDGSVDRPASRAGALSGMAAQRFQEHAELPVVPHAGRSRSRCRSRACSASRAKAYRGTRSSPANFFMQRMLNRYRDELERRRAAAGADGRGRPRRFAFSARRPPRIRIDGVQRRIGPAARRRDRSRISAATNCRRRIPRAAPGCTSSSATLAGGPCSSLVR